MRGVVGGGYLNLMDHNTLLLRLVGCTEPSLPDGALIVRDTGSKILVCYEGTDSNSRTMRAC
jgi:hypothetical protein